jgi:hypothetical protein
MSALAAQAPDPAQNAGVPTFGDLESVRTQTAQYGANPNAGVTVDTAYMGIGIPSAASKGNQAQPGSLIGT